MPLGIDGGIDALATKQSPGLFLPNANAFGASCLLHCVQFTHRTLQFFLQIHAYSYFPRRAAKANFDRYAPAAARANTASGAMDENTHQQEVPPSGECSVCQPCCKW